MAWPEHPRGGLLAAAAARAEAWLFDPAPARVTPRSEREPPVRPVVAVIGLGARCGATTVARALAVELAARDPSGTAVVTAVPGPVPPALAAAGARRLARALGCRPAGRLAMLPGDDPALRQLAVDRPAPVVLDVGHGSPPESALALADRAVLVASPAVERSLAEVALATLARGSVRPLLVLNRAVDPDAWGGAPDVVVGEARLGARLAHAGREPLGALRAAGEALADACVEALRA